ncbi:hypothetical protein [Undibacterium sp. Tian12W]|uniref:hypothetical protein n=1 Tax=Undibacterium sp. Tian12W TaxID=3413054 RepID=UPI003BF3189B
MGVDLQVVVDIGLKEPSHASVLTALQSSYEDMCELWHDHYEVPVNAGFKALNLEKFKEVYTANWTMPEFIPKKNFAGDDIPQAYFCLNGPYGWRAELCQDAVVFNDSTRWARFCNDDQWRQLMIASISLFASALSSSRACFIPDSSYCGSECADTLWENGNFNAVYNCLQSQGHKLQKLQPAMAFGHMEFIAVMTG